MGYDRRGPGGYHTDEMKTRRGWYRGREQVEPVSPLVGSDELAARSTRHQQGPRPGRRAGAASRYWVDIGSGKWDAMGRPSEVRADRIIRVHPDRVRRAARQWTPGPSSRWRPQWPVTGMIDDWHRPPNALDSQPRRFFGDMRA